MLTIVIPTLNSAQSLPRTLEALNAEVEGIVADLAMRDRARGDGLVLNDVVIVDGGSTDGTKAVASDFGVRVIEAPAGRGAQLAAGAAHVNAQADDWLLFLHADTRLPDNWRALVGDFMDDAANAGRAAYFRLAFDDDSAGARRVARLANWRSKRFGLPYGDQGLLISGALYQSVGGYGSLPLMEDVDLVRRIGARHLVELQGTVVTSASRYERDGYVLRPLRNLLCLGLFACGVSPARIAKIYR